MSQDGDAQALGSAASALSERLNTLSLMFRGTLRMNGVVIDSLGRMIPQELEELVDKHI
jgi:hypothetical protein